MYRVGGFPLHGPHLELVGGAVGQTGHDATGVAAVAARKPVILDDAITVQHPVLVAPRSSGRFPAQGHPPVARIGAQAGGRQQRQRKTEGDRLVVGACREAGGRVLEPFGLGPIQGARAVPAVCGRCPDGGDGGRNRDTGLILLSLRPPRASPSRVSSAPRRGRGAGPGTPEGRERGHRRRGGWGWFQEESGGPAPGNNERQARGQAWPTPWPPAGRVASEVSGGEPPRSGGGTSDEPGDSRSRVPSPEFPSPESRVPSPESRVPSPESSREFRPCQVVIGQQVTLVQGSIRLWRAPPGWLHGEGDTDTAHIVKRW